MTVDDTEENVHSCTCPDCPSYDDCARGKDETLFCARGVSACALPQNGCICDECSVWDVYELTDMYFCRNGAVT